MKVGALSGFELLPGIPVAALGTVCPVVAAVILVAVDAALQTVLTLD